MTEKQELGKYGEELVRKKCDCPKCKKSGTLQKLTPSFKCADIICDVCGYLGQVKTHTVKSNDVMQIPDKILGAAWGPQKERMDYGIYFPLFLVLRNTDSKTESIHYLSADLQNIKMFEPRTKLKETAKRAGWQGFMYNLQSVKDSFVCLYNNS